MSRGHAPLIAPGHLAANWNRLRRSQGVNIIEVVLSRSGVTVALALTREGRPRFLLPADPHTPLAAGLSGDSLRVSRSFVRFGGRDQPCLDVMCLQEALDRTFFEFTSAVLERIDSGSRPRDALADAVQEFRRLLRRSGTRPVSLERALGLLGELCLLRDLMALDNGAWRTWNGPLGQVHDFLNGRHALEVKSTLTAHEPVVEISNVDQLYPPADGGLHLLHFIFTPNANGKLSVPEQAEALRTADGDCSGLDERLGAVGYDPVAPEPWAAYRFTLTQRSLYRVGPGFPRLDRNSVLPLPAGVSHLRFRVDLTLAAGLQVLGKTDQESVLRKFLGG